MSNPILSEVRGMIHDGSEPLRAYQTYLRWLGSGIPLDPWTEEDHRIARKVLSRLTA
jgi:hypothetical protein